MAYRFDVLVPCLAEDQDVFNDASRIRDVVEYVGHPTTVVVTGVHHPAWKSKVLVPSDWGRKRSHGRALFVQGNLVVPLEGVHHDEKLHPRGNGTHRLEGSLGLKPWPDNTLV